MPSPMESMREALELARARIATFPDGGAKALLVSQTESLSKELDAAGSFEVTDLLRRKIALLHVVLAKAAPRRRRHAVTLSH